VRVLVLGSGGREHALARALAADPDVTDLHVAPGNPGIAAIATVHSVDLADVGAATGLARSLGAGLVVVGPEAPLVAGLADALQAAGIGCFGPGRRAAMLEGSKSFAKQVMREARIPTAAARTCCTAGEAEAALAEFGPPYVVKADGLAAGKGVVVTTDLAAALAHARSAGMGRGGGAGASRARGGGAGANRARGGEAGANRARGGGAGANRARGGGAGASRVLVEEFLDGPEVSLFALADGVTAVPLLPAQDFKRAHDGDQGPNTGGMGAYAPLPWAPPGLTEEVMGTVIQPAIDAMRRRGTPYRGLLYAGLCLTKEGPRVVEFNARFGDPETQVVVDRLASPLAGPLAAAASGSLSGAGPLRWAPGAAVALVIAAQDYPGAPVTGDVIDGVQDAERSPGAYVLHAGTATGRGKLVTAGGRVLNVVGTGPDLAAARAAAYAAAARIRIRGAWYRTDIAATAAQNPT
jgi:phosphoribosylamine--glycine ligase